MSAGRDFACGVYMFGTSVLIFGAVGFVILFPLYALWTVHPAIPIALVGAAMACGVWGVVHKVGDEMCRTDGDPHDDDEYIGY